MNADQDALRLGQRDGTVHHLRVATVASLGGDVRPVDVRHHPLVVSEDVGPEALSAVTVRRKHDRRKKGGWGEELAVRP